MAEPESARPAADQGGPTIARLWPAALGVGATYYLLAVAGVHLTIMPEGIAILWPPNAVLLVAIMLVPVRQWWLFLVAAIVAEVAADYGSFPVWQALGFGLVNGAEAVIAATVIGRFDPPRSKPIDLRRTAVMAVAILFVATPIAALGGSWLYRVADPTVDVAVFWRLWWFGDAVGLILLAPAFLVWFKGWRNAPALIRGRGIEAALLGAVLVGGSTVLFGMPEAYRQWLGSPSLLLPALVWAAVRFGALGASLGSIIAAVILLAGTTAGRGVFANMGSETLVVLAAQEFLLIVSLVSLSLGLGSDLLIGKIADAKAANEAKTQFLRNMSHELRTPLNAVLGFTGLLRARLSEGKDAGADAKITEYLGHIQTGGTHLLALVGQVLELNQLDGPASQPKYEVFSIKPMVPAAVAMIKADCQRPDVTIADDVAERPCPDLRADRLMVNRILLNLLSNAVRYNEDGGCVRISANPVGKGFVRLVVEDTGPGLVAEQIPKAFEAFNRLGRESGAIAGAGIGLTLVQRLAEAMGGQVGCDSVVGKGSRFWVDLPTA